VGRVTQGTLRATALAKHSETCDRTVHCTFLRAGRWGTQLEIPVTVFVSKGAVHDTDGTLIAGFVEEGVVRPQRVPG
jgi:hypothetical protein